MNLYEWRIVEWTCTHRSSSLSEERISWAALGLTRDLVKISTNCEGSVGMPPSLEDDLDDVRTLDWPLDLFVTVVWSLLWLLLWDVFRSLEGAGTDTTRRTSTGSAAAGRFFGLETFTNDWAGISDDSFTMATASGATSLTLFFDLWPSSASLRVSSLCRRLDFFEDFAFFDFSGFSEIGGMGVTIKYSMAVRMGGDVPGIGCNSKITHHCW